MKKSKGVCDAPLTSPKKKLTSKNPGIPFPTTVTAEGIILAQPMTTLTYPTGGEGTGLGDSTIKDPTVAIKLAQSSLLPINVKMVNKMELDEVTAQLYRLNT